MNLFKMMLAILLSTAVAACSPGSGGTTAGGSGTIVGHFIDSAVVGLTYSYTLNGQTTTATTGVGGSFNYPAGTPVTFKIGNITLGTITPSGTVTPLQLAGNGSTPAATMVRNIVQLLISLDPAAQTIVSAGISQPDTITLNTALLTAAANTNVTPITISASTSQTQLQTILTQIGNITGTTYTLINPTQATTHMTSSLNGIFAGNYSGTYSGASSGTWTITINSAGIISGSTGTGDAITGAMSTTLNTNAFNFNGTASGYPWNGTLDGTGKFSGTWGTGNTTGTYTGTKQ